MHWYDSRTKTFRNYKKGNGPGDLSSNAVFALLDDKEGNIYIGLNEGGLNVLNKATHRVTRYQNDPVNPSESLVNDDIRVFCQDSDGTIWIGTYAGLSRFDPLTKKFTNYLDVNSKIVGQAVFSIHQDRKGNIWVGTMGALNLFDKTSNTFTPFTEQSGLANATIKYITEDAKGQLWLSSNKGITRFDPATKTFYNYESEHGLQGYEFFHSAGFQTRDGSILMGGINGFNLFHPTWMERNNVAPQIVISGFALFNKPVNIKAEGSPLTQAITETKEIVLTHDQSVFTIEYTALGYTIPEKNSYAFILEGFDEKWNYVGSQRNTTYTNLDAGEYVFRVKATDLPGCLLLLIFSSDALSQNELRVSVSMNHTRPRF